jgi:hypothetical protein
MYHRTEYSGYTNSASKNYLQGKEYTKRCASCWHSVEDDEHIFTCEKRKSQRKKIFKETNVLRNTVDPVLCDILKEGLLAYFRGECITTTMLRIRGQEGMD